MLFVFALSACGPAEEEDWLAEVEGELGRFDMHRLLEDEDLTGGQTISAASVQEYLERRGSFLASYTDPSWRMTAAELISDRSRAYGINPVYTLARLQAESGLVSSRSGRSLSRAAGCGCSDGRACSGSYQGFGNQIECSSTTMRDYLESLASSGRTVSGWRVGSVKRTLEGCQVRPATAATAALYTYTPWVGAYARPCGRSGVGGASLLRAIYARFSTEVR